MRTIVSILALVCAVVIAGVLSGQIVPSTRPADVQTPPDARTRALHALEIVDRRIHRVTGEVGADNEETLRASAELRARSKTIRRRVEKLDPDDDAQRGAWAGVRASIADLEYRTDILMLTTRSSSLGFRAAAEPTIAETLVTIEALRSSLGAQDQLDHSESLERMQTELERLRTESADDVPASRASDDTRAAWARRLAVLRRELRSIDRQVARNAAPIHR